MWIFFVDTNILEEHVASIVRSEDGGSMFLRRPSLTILMKFITSTVQKNKHRTIKTVFLEADKVLLV
jgi:hypothetical protein